MVGIEVKLSNFFCILFTFLASSFVQLCAHTELEGLSNMERHYLNKFFHRYFVDDDFAYTLFGDKPMSFSGICNQNTSVMDTIRKNNSHLPTSHTFLIFKKWRNSLQNENFLFILNEESDSYFIYFINKTAFLNEIDKNIDVFLKELGEDFTADAFLRELTEERKSLLDIIHHHEGILGILLGYGRHNALLFQAKADILGRCWAYDEENYQKPSQTSLGFTSIKEELNYLDGRLTSFSNESEYCPLMPVSPLGFASDSNHPETKKLKHQYRAVQERVNQAYSRASPLEVFICALFK